MTSERTVADATYCIQNLHALFRNQTLCKGTGDEARVEPRDGPSEQPPIMCS